MIRKTKYFFQKFNRKKYKEKYKMKKYIKWRFFFLYFFIVISFFILAIRVTYLQIIFSKDLIKKNDIRSLRIQKIISKRGIIQDRNGCYLAVSIPSYAIWIDPKIINKSKITGKRWKMLADKLQISIENIKNKINLNPKSRFAYLARNVSLSVGKYIANLKLEGVYLSNEMKRYYPYGPITANLLGITNIDNQGIEGVEKSFNYFLNGKSGKKIIRKDLYGRVIENVLFINKKNSHDLILSIDIRMQSIIYKALQLGVKKNKAKSGIAVLIDIKTGEVLAMTNIPSYNPNSFYKIKTSFMRNRAITDLFEPGSTVKPMIVITALKNNIIKDNSILNTKPYFINGHKVKDIVEYKKLSITEILQKSSNVGISKLALSLSKEQIIETYKKFGLGESTNLGLIGESRGFFLKKKKWSKFEKIAFSIGYGIMVTPLQLARVYATIGNFGVYKPLSIKKNNSVISGFHIFPKNIVRTVIHMMERVSLPGGVGVRAAIKNYRIAIKTGTVKKVNINGNYINKYIAYTAGIAPVSNPRYALVVMINEPSAGKYYGGIVSAPIFGIIMDHILNLKNVKPDKLKEK